MSDNREFIDEFLVESSENLDQLDRDLLALEQRPDDAQRVASIFRTVHTIKGNSGFFGFSKLGALAHSGEHLLGKLRDGKLTLDDRVTGSLYSMVDAVRTILRSIEETGAEGDQDYRELSRTLAALAAEEPMAADPAAAPRPAAAPPPAPAGAVPAADPPASPAAPGQATATGGVADSTVRVDVGLLASILDLVGELVLARNQLRSVDSDDPAVQACTQRINAVTNALQETAVKTRLQPVEHVFSRFPRTVRDLAVACGKEVHLAIDGADTELDRSLIESIRDPLTHLVRNAVDHGIEPPQVRIAAGKPRAGRLSLRAFNESGRVTIEVSDDGAGIAYEKIRERAVARGLVTATEAAAMPPDRVLQFIFEPGFSTAATVTSVSGRGVGMDVVRTNIEAIGGTVAIHSVSGAGTIVRVHVPLTLAIVPALVVHCGGERFAIPQAAVLELVRLRPDRDGPRIEGLPGAAVMRFRGRLVPLVFLDTFLGLRAETACRGAGTVVIVRVDEHEFGLVVDGLRGPTAQDGSRGTETASLTTIVVKPIGGRLAQLGVYAGATVLGDGGLVLILDPRGFPRAARLAAIPPPPATVAAAAVGERYLVCTTRAGRRIAVPLGTVSRLERHPRQAIETLGPRSVVRRGDLLTPVVDADAVLGAASGPATELARLVVLDHGGSGLAVEVGRIEDVLSAPAAGAAATGGVPMLSLGGRAAELIDGVAVARLTPT